MGIPAYFSQIIRDFPQIFIEYIKNEIQINNLYLDCNGIIYDQIIHCSKDKDIDNFENELIEKTCKKIDYYINFGGDLDDIQWRKLGPQQLFKHIKTILSKRLHA